MTRRSGTQDPAAAPGRWRRRRRGLLAMVAIMAIGWLAIGLGFRAAYSDEILPGTRAAGIDLGGVSAVDARRRLASAFPPGQIVTMGYRSRRLPVRAADAGVQVDLTATVARARRAGSDGPLDGVLSLARSLVAPREVDVAFRVDQRRLDAAIASIAREIDRPAFPGALSIDRGGMRVRAVPPRPGRALDRAATATAVLAALRRRERGVVPLRVRIRERVTRRQVEAVARRAEAYLDKPLPLTGRRDSATLARRQLAPLLGVEYLPGAMGGRVRLGIRRQPLERLVETLAEELERDPVDARMLASARPFVIDGKGDLAWRPRRASLRVVPGRSGRSLGRSATAEAIAGAVRRGRHTAHLPLARVPADVPTRSARKVTSAIGTFTTRFSCCEPRVRNIRLIAKAVDRTVVAAGERFSLNRVAGRRTRAKGYVPAPFIADGKLVPSVGGGVSQFSTTLYNAAYFAGLQVDRHQPHSLYISRYPPGREATLDYPSIDLEWTNDTKAPVLVRTAVDDTSVTVTLYGDNGGRRVEAQTGARVPGRRGALRITVTRTIRYRGGRTVRQPFTTSYDEPPR